MSHVTVAAIIEAVITCVQVFCPLSTHRKCGGQIVLMLTDATVQVVPNDAVSPTHKYKQLKLHFVKNIRWNWYETRHFQERWRPPVDVPGCAL